MIVVGDRGTGEGPEYPVSEQFPLQELFASGVLWAINRYVFHPRGYALAIRSDTDQLELWGDGTEPWQYDEATDDKKMVAFEDTLARLKKAWAEQKVNHATDDL